ncbi:MAG: hypothetical protein AAGL89_10070 [Pseudomonadota bacterium]
MIQTDRHGLTFRVDAVRDVSIYPHLGPVSLEVAPCLKAGFGTYAHGAVEHLAYEAVDLEGGTASAALQVGGTYVVAARDDEGALVRTHWMYCTQTDPHPRFGMCRNHRKPDICVPAPFVGADPFVLHEGLVNLIGFTSLTVAEHGMSEFKLGDTGALIATAFGAPRAMGLRIDTPFLPPHFQTGARDLTIFGTAPRTGQTVQLDHLTCIRSQHPAIFLQDNTR